MAKRAKPAKVAAAPAKAVRLPVGGYAYRGRAVPFSKLPKREQSRFRTVWSNKAARTVRVQAREARAAAAAPAKWNKVQRSLPRGEYRHLAVDVHTLKLRAGQDAGIALDKLAALSKEPRASTMVTLKWADGSITRASLPYAKNDPANVNATRRWIETIVRSDGANLKGKKGSTGPGKPQILAVTRMAGAGKKKGKKGRKKVSPDEGDEE